MAILGLTLSMEEIDGQSRLQDNIQESRKIIPEEQSISYEKKDVRRWTFAVRITCLYQMQFWQPFW